MSNDIAKMNDKQLRNEVQLLRDELAIMKRKYEDIIYNLDTDNFSSRFVKEQGDMRTAIKVNAEGIETKVSNEEFQSTKTQLAEQIEFEVKTLGDADKELSSKITQTADAIRSEVKSATDTINGKFDNYSTIEQTADAIKSQAYASADLSSALEISDISKATDITKTYYIKDSNGNKTYYYYNEISTDWEEIIGGGIDTVFEQTAEGFKLKGNVKIDGSCVLTDSLTFDSSDNPLQVEYSVDGINNWHSTFASGSDKFMRLKIGARWSDAMKIVGDNGQNGLNGTNGTNATVTTQDIFNFLTNNGADQGTFPFYREAPYNGGSSQTQVFINAEYIRSGQISADYIDTDNLSCTRLYARGYTTGWYAKMSSSVGDFGVYNASASSSANPADSDCIWGIYHSDPLTEVVNFYSYGNNYMGYNNSQMQLYPKGVWNFGACTDVLGLDKFVSGGGTAIAVFG